jgi:HupE / UreJ protein
MAQRKLFTGLRAKVVILALLAGAIPSPATAHSLDSSTIAIRIGEGAVEATLSLPLETLNVAVGTDRPRQSSDLPGADELVTYLDQHLGFTGADGHEWGETYTSPRRKVIEGIDSVNVVVRLDLGGSGTERFTLTYDAIVAELPDHEAIVLVTSSNGEVSAPGIMTAENDTLAIRDGAKSVAIVDMVGYGLRHVLEGPDHLLFLIALLLPAPLIAVARRWDVRGGTRSTSWRVFDVVTSFAIGHSLTMIAAASGWVSVPARPVEILIAASVGVASLHAIRPLVAHGEAIFAGLFGLVHGFAFASILTDLGLDELDSLKALLAFNVGVELAQIITVSLTLPALYLMSTTRFYSTIRVAGASSALAAAAGWGLERTGTLPNPLAGAEDAAIAHPWHIVVGLALIAGGVAAVEQLLPECGTLPPDSRSPTFSDDATTRPDNR